MKRIQVTIGGVQHIVEPDDVKFIDVPDGAEAEIHGQWRKPDGQPKEITQSDAEFIKQVASLIKQERE